MDYQLVMIYFMSLWVDRKNRGFTLIELLIVITIIGILASIVFIGVLSIRIGLEAAKVAAAGQQQRIMTTAIELYYIDMEFFPPDVNRGWDPGFVRPLPWNADEEAGEPPTGAFALPGTNCDHCPPNWQDIVLANWKGPYMSSWPRFTPWKGKYDYNYWGSGATRYGCTVPPGVYVGVQGNYDNDNIIPPSAEQRMIKNGFDVEQCLNGESQMILRSLSS